MEIYLPFIVVDFGSDLQVRWKLRENKISRKWFSCLKNGIAYGISERDRFYNFPNQNWTVDKIVKSLEDCISDIEIEYPNFFTLRPSVDMSQDDFNILHDHFDRLRGEVIDASEYYRNASDHVKDRINQFNVLIHRWEDFEANQESEKNTGESLARFVCTFKDSFKVKLDQADYKFFSLARPYGAMMINYCQVGKPLWDVFDDQDEVINWNTIRPLRYCGANFVVKFSKEISEEDHDRQMTAFYAWFDSKTEMNAHGFYKNDPKLAIGHIVVADLISEMDLVEIGKRSFIENVKIEY